MKRAKAPSGYLGHKGWQSTNLIWLGKPNRSKLIEYRVYWRPLTGLLRDKGETGIGIVIQTTEKLLSSNHIKHKDVNRPQGWAHDGVKVTIIAPLEKTALMFFWWSRALQLKAIISHCIHTQWYTHLNLRKHTDTMIYRGTCRHMSSLTLLGHRTQTVNTNERRARARPRGQCQRPHLIGFLISLDIQSNSQKTDFYLHWSHKGGVTQQHTEISFVCIRYCTISSCTVCNSTAGATELFKITAQFFLKGLYSLYKWHPLSLYPTC